MKLNKLLAAALLSFSLYSCSCEDVNLGKLEQTDELASFLPVQPTEGKSYQVKYGDKKVPMYYHSPDVISNIQIPVKETGKSGMGPKGGSYDCIEYYTAEEKDYFAYIEGENPVNIITKYTKDANQYGFNSIKDKEQVADVIEFIVGFNNKFPTTVTRGMGSYDSFMPHRSFTLAKDPETLLFKRSDMTQEFIPTITLNGVQHQNVYHLYLNSPQYTDDEKFFNQYYPLDYPQGIYVKEGIGIVQAYTAEGKQIDITIE